MGAGLAPAPGPAQRLAVQQLGPGQVERAQLALVQRQGLLEVGAGVGGLLLSLQRRTLVAVRATASRFPSPPDGP